MAKKLVAWSVLDGSGNPLTTVYAAEAEEARQEAERQLSKNPSRRQALAAWNRGGRRVELKW